MRWLLVILASFVMLPAEPRAEKKYPPKKVEGATPRAEKTDPPDPRKVNLDAGKIRYVRQQFLLRLFVEHAAVAPAHDAALIQEYQVRCVR